MQKKTVFFIICVLVISFLGFLFNHWYQQNDNQLTLYGNIDIREVRLAFQVPGKIRMLTADEGDCIKAGQILAELDNQSYIAKVDTAHAHVKLAKSQLNKLLDGARREELLQLEALVKARQADAIKANKNYHRISELTKDDVISASSLETVVAENEKAQANLDAARASYRLLKEGPRPEEIDSAKAKLSAAESVEKSAQIDLANTVLIAPQSGTISTRISEIGSIVSMGSPIYTLSLDSFIRVRSYVDEKNLGKIHLGQSVCIYSDSYPNKVYYGKISNISSVAEFTPHAVQTPELRTDLVYQFLVVVNPISPDFRQGMPVTLKIKTDI